jgi:hypothetical protein
VREGVGHPSKLACSVELTMNCVGMSEARACEASLPKCASRNAPLRAYIEFRNSRASTQAPCWWAVLTAIALFGRQVHPLSSDDPPFRASRHAGCYGYSGWCGRGKGGLIQILVHGLCLDRARDCIVGSSSTVIGRDRNGVRQLVPASPTAWIQGRFWWAWGCQATIGEGPSPVRSSPMQREIQHCRPITPALLRDSDEIVPT